MSNKTDSTLYVGVTNDLERRVAEHRSGAIPGFTEKYHCHKLVYFERYSDVNQAIAREKQLKKWSRSKKDWLIDTMNKERVDLMKCHPEPCRGISPCATLSRDDKPFTVIPTVMEYSALPLATAGTQESLNKGQQSVLDCIKANPGLRVPKLSEGTNIPSKSIERHISVLIARNLIEHRGSKKTGGYYAK